MTDQKNEKQVHILIRVEDYIDNVHFAELYLSEENEKDAIAVRKFIFSKSPLDSLSPSSLQIFQNIILTVNEKIIEACLSDFDMAARLLARLRKEHISEEQTELIVTAIRDIAEYRQTAAPAITSPQKVYDSISEAIRNIPPLYRLAIVINSQLKLDYLKKKRGAEYGS